MNKSRNAIRLDDLSPAMRAQALEQLGQPRTIHVPEPSVPRALQPMKEKHLLKQKRSGLNKLESAFFEYLKHAYPKEEIMPHGITLLLSNTCRYTPDFTCLMESGIVFWETKGPFFREDAKIKLRMAATKFHRATFYLVQKIEGQWRIEKVLP